MSVINTRNLIFHLYFEEKDKQMINTICIRFTFFTEKLTSFNMLDEYFVFLHSLIAHVEGGRIVPLSLLTHEYRVPSVYFTTFD